MLSRLWKGGPTSYLSQYVLVHVLVHGAHDDDDAQKALALTGQRRFMPQQVHMLLDWAGKRTEYDPSIRWSLYYDLNSGRTTIQDITPIVVVRWNARHEYRHR